MKPLKLILKNFGPYRDETIDFNLLSELFLITGPTGAGKTFIFDAMTFALYGEVKGNRMSLEKTLKSTFADREEESFVEFTFELGLQIYKVHRTLPYDHISRTNKVTSRSSEIQVFTFNKTNECFEPLWEGVKLSEINKNLIQIIGLKADEFSMVVVLPQGEFAKFLKENSNDRTETLSKLFPVQIYKELMVKAKEKCDVLSSELAGITNALKQNLSDGTYDEILQHKSALEKQVNEISQKKDSLQISFDNLNKNYVLLEKDYKAARDYEENLKLKESLEKQKNDISQNEEIVNKARKALHVFPKYQAFCNCAEETEKLQKDFDIISSDVLELKNTISKLESDKNKIKTLKDELPQKTLGLSKLEKALKIDGELKIINTRFEETKITVSEIEDAIKNQEILLQELELQKHNEEVKNLSGTLAVELKENEPCPVCGSIHHPSPAKVFSSSLSLGKQIETLNQSLESLRTDSRKKETLFSELKTKKDLYEKDFSETGFSLPLPDINDLRKNIDSITKEINDFENQFNSLSNQYASKSGKQEQLEISISQNKIRALEFEKEYKKAFDESGFASEEEMKKSYLDEGKLNSLEDSISDWKNKVSAVDAVLKSSSIKKSSEEIRLELADTEKEKNIIEKELKENQREYENNLSLLGQITHTLQTIESLESKRVKLEKEREPLKRLEDDLNGKNPKKLNFDSWALGVYFDKVLSAASERFKEISGKRYYFKMKDTVTGNGKKGLDFLVCDTYNGTEREVGTLSGGETFMASISLALAMTDIVGARSAGISMDSLFIDEGFGTLDTEVQDQAIEILTRLSDGNKKVGIISHVENLKQRVKSQIQINKTTSGSHVKIV